MNKQLKFIVIVIVIFSNTLSIAQNVGINPSGTAPDPSAGLDVNFTNKGFLVPRLTTAQRDAITSPAEGLMIYNTTSKCYEGYNDTENAWFPLGCLMADGQPYNPWPEGYVHCGIPTEIVDVVSTTGKKWMDRNLGASQAATASDDATSYGDLFQWGRFADGHQCKTSLRTSVMSSSDTPESDNFITYGLSLPYDWRNPQNGNLWQGVAGINNPCPSGYRLPTNAEQDAERETWLSYDASGALNAPLKLPLAGYRDGTTGLFGDFGNGGYYWSSSVYNTISRYFGFYSFNAYINSIYRSYGLSVRCIKN